MKAKHRLARPISSAQGRCAVNKHTTSIVLLASVISGLAVLAFASPQSAYAQSITVDRTDGPAVVVWGVGTAVGAAANDCSLRGVTLRTNDHLGTTITIPAGAYQFTVAGTLAGGNCHDEKIGGLDADGVNTGIVATGIASTLP
jgi:hypothetical protein